MVASIKYAQNQRQQPTFFGGEEVFFKKERVAYTIPTSIFDIGFFKAKKCSYYTSSIDRFYLLPPLHSCILLLLDFCWICHAATYDALLAGNGFVPTRLVQVARTNHFSQIKSRYTDISGSFSLHTGRTPLNLLQQRKTMHFRSQKKCRKTESRGIHSFLLH
ncbi:unnamed protein product [Albugo candida]|uniref:Uncharacterized protein n=1 Tax=Albugo candida TaxID=65357 RepID=A0A024FXU2_9STRA|nr:unnamed protein product [Albugo candida]|eukprot:CCI11469.1 unnamed protein product [Albugo candida]